MKSPIATTTRAVIAVLLVLVALIPGPALLAVPPGATPTIPDERGRRQQEFDWQGLLEGMMRDRGRDRNRYDPDRYDDRETRPRPRPRPRPDYQPPDYQPVEPYYPIEPNVQPRYIEPPPIETLPSNVTPTPAVTVEIPRQQMPWSGIVWEASVRESRCYGGELKQMSEKGLATFRESLGKTGAEGTALYDELEELRLLLEQGSLWRDVEPVMRRVFDGHRDLFVGPTLQQWQKIARMLIVRDAFISVAKSAPRARGSALKISAIPTGVIWVVFDPTLPVGFGLLVTPRLLVCGGTEPDLQIVSMSAAEALGLPVAPGDPTPDISADEARSLPNSVVLINRDDAGAPINYVLNGRYTYSMEPGEKQRLKSTQSWTIAFDRGGGRGAARYTLKKGAYEFRVVAGRWELVRLKYRVKIDNTAGKSDFQYVMNNEVVTVKAGQAKDYETEQPIVLEFDRGEGVENPARKNLNKNGTYKVAVDTETNYLDLFATESVEPEDDDVARSTG